MKASWSKLTLALAISTALSGCSDGGSSAAPEAVTNPVGNDNSTVTPGEKAKGSTPDYSRITDAALRECVTTVGVELTEQLQLLECPHLGITSLAGLEQFTELRVLNLKNNQLSSVQELQSLSKLSWLDISHNQLEDGSVLNSLVQLASLQASNNQLQSLDELKLPKLSKLYISNNQLSSLDFISDLPALKHLIANNNPASMPGDMPDSLETFRI